MDMETFQGNKIFFYFYLFLKKKNYFLPKRLAIFFQLQHHAPTVTELKRAQRLLDHGHRFAMEGVGSLAQHLGQATLMNRLEPLEEPLLRWHQCQPETLQQVGLALDPEQACTLLVTPQ